jgi:hypothetical protein
LSDSAKSKIDLLPNNIPVVKVLLAEASSVRCRAVVQRSAGRWAPRSEGHGSEERQRGTCEDGSRTLPRSRLMNSALVVSVVPGSTRSLQLSVSAGLAQDRILRCKFPEDGGDEETRTPDLLLAKEMLYQLSYVP